MAKYTYTCLQDCTFPVEPCGVRTNPDGSGTEISLTHFFRQGDTLRNPDDFDPLPGGPNANKGPHAVVNRCFACSDDAVEAQRQELWQREDAETAIRERESSLQRTENTPTMQLVKQQAQMQAAALKGAFSELAKELRAPVEHEPERKKKEHWKTAKKREQEQTAGAASE